MTLYPRRQTDSENGRVSDLSHIILIHTSDLKMLVRKSNIQLLGDILHDAKMLITQ
jgi:hypothetical protein